MQVLFALHDAALLSGMQLAGVTTKGVEPIHTGRSRVDVFLELYEVSGGSVVGQIEYDSSLWKRSSIKAMAANFLVRSGLFVSLFASDCPISTLTGKLSMFVLAVFHTHLLMPLSVSQHLGAIYCWQSTIATISLSFVCLAG